MTEGPYGLMELPSPRRCARCGHSDSDHLVHDYEQDEDILVNCAWVGEGSPDEDVSCRCPAYVAPKEVKP